MLSFVSILLNGCLFNESFLEGQNYSSMDYI